ncbi:DUF6157 family protein [Parafrankia soli]|nr:DUF6157 family protein [Parafrankia soli]
MLPSMELVDYVNTFIVIADDCPVAEGTAPPVKGDNPSIAARAYEMIARHPYSYTSGDVIFGVFADRRDIPADERSRARAEFYSRGQACLRASDLGRRYGWGIHADAQGRLALYGAETPEYATFAAGRRHDDAGRPVTVRKAMRRSRR